jgi:hypothetical protein
MHVQAGENDQAWCAQNMTRRRSPQLAACPSIAGGSGIFYASALCLLPARFARALMAVCCLRMSLVVFGVQIDAGGLDRRVPQVFLDEAQVGAGVGQM